MHPAKYTVLTALITEHPAKYAVLTALITEHPAKYAVLTALMTEHSDKYNGDYCVNDEALYTICIISNAIIVQTLSV